MTRCPPSSVGLQATLLFLFNKAVLLLFLLLGSVACVTPGKKACKEDRQCDINEYCEPSEGRCTFGCSDDSRCPPGQSCFQTLCKPIVCGAKSSKKTPEEEACYTGSPSHVEKAIQEAGGQCRQGTKTCIQNGQAWSPCYLEVTPTSEICDGADNDCDGKTDEDAGSCTCAPGAFRMCSTSPRGTLLEANDVVVLCRKGVQRCTDKGRWGACQGEIRPHQSLSQRTECSDTDGDCDGRPDDLCSCEASTPERTCTITLPGVPLVCKLTGKQICKRLCFDPKKEPSCPDAEAVYRWMPCRPLSCVEKDGMTECKEIALPTLEEAGSPTPCNGKDDDCDGKIDNRFDKPDEPLSRPCYPGLPGCTINDDQTQGSCQGICAFGRQICKDGRWSSDCLGAGLPEKELCDGKDNDCNGQIDDGLAARPCFDGATGCSKKPDGTFVCTFPCRSGLQICQGGAWTACKDQRLPQDESKASGLCNDGQDNDCDGKIDGDDTGCQ